MIKTLQLDYDDGAVRLHVNVDMQTWRVTGLRNLTDTPDVPNFVGKHFAAVAEWSQRFKKLTTACVSIEEEDTVKVFYLMHVDGMEGSLMVSDDIAKLLEAASGVFKPDAIVEVERVLDRVPLAGCGTRLYNGRFKTLVERGTDDFVRFVLRQDAQLFSNRMLRPENKVVSEFDVRQLGKKEQAAGHIQAEFDIDAMNIGSLIKVLEGLGDYEFED